MRVEDACLLNRNIGWASSDAYLDVEDVVLFTEFCNRNGLGCGVQANRAKPMAEVGMTPVNSATIKAEDKAGV